jgi:transposase
MLAVISPARDGSPTLPKVAAEMALSVLAYNLTRGMNIVGIKPLMAAIAA